MEITKDEIENFSITLKMVDIANNLIMSKHKNDKLIVKACNLCRNAIKLIQPITYLSIVAGKFKSTEPQEENAIRELPRNKLLYHAFTAPSNIKEFWTNKKRFSAKTVLQTRNDDIYVAGVQLNNNKIILSSSINASLKLLKKYANYLKKNGNKKTSDFINTVILPSMNLVLTAYNMYNNTNFLYSDYKNSDLIDDENRVLKRALSIYSLYNGFKNAKNIIINHRLIKEQKKLNNYKNSLFSNDKEQLNKIEQSTLIGEEKLYDIKNNICEIYKALTTAKEKEEKEQLKKQLDDIQNRMIKNLGKIYGKKLFKTIINISSYLHLDANNVNDLYKIPNTNIQIYNLELAVSSANIDAIKYLKAIGTDLNLKSHIGANTTLKNLYDMALDVDSKIISNIRSIVEKKDTKDIVESIFNDYNNKEYYGLTKQYFKQAIKKYGKYEKQINQLFNKLERENQQNVQVR